MSLLILLCTGIVLNVAFGYQPAVFAAAPPRWGAADAEIISPIC